MKRLLVLCYGLIAYAIFFGTFLYLIGFNNDLLVPQSLAAVAPDAEIGSAVLINLLMVALFGVQHSVMARPGFKAWLTKFIAPAVERSTFVLVTSGILWLMFTRWQPLPGVVWATDGITADVLTAVSFAGWAIVLLSTFLIDHFELFGLKQTIGYALGREFRPPQFRVRWFYRFTRHPLMLGFVIAFWAVPTMTFGHLLFTAAFSCFILVALQLEERDLLAAHGEAYAQYRREVPMLLPLGNRGTTV